MLFNKEQLQIVLLIKKGKTNAQIGDELGYSADCIKKRLSSLYKKLGVKRRAELVGLLFSAPHKPPASSA